MSEILPALSESHLAIDQLRCQGLFFSQDSLLHLHLPFSHFSLVLEQFLALLIELGLFAALVQIELVLLGLELTMLTLEQEFLLLNTFTLMLKLVDFRGQF